MTAAVIGSAVFALDIIDRAATVFGLSHGEVIGNRRIPSMVHARWACMVAMDSRSMTRCSIGRRLRKDRTTVLNGLRRAVALRAVDPEFDALCRRVAGL